MRWMFLVYHTLWFPVFFTNLKGYEIILSAWGCEGRGKELEGAKKIVEYVDREFEELVWYEVDGLYYAKTFMKKTKKKVLIRSKEKTLEVFKNLEWYATILDEFPEIDCGRCKVVEGYDERRGRSYRVVVIDGIEDENLGLWTLKSINHTHITLKFWNLLHPLIFV
ncbi:MAG: hypothetical protein ABDH28_07555 [Brevinematia bacterium]